MSNSDFISLNHSDISGPASATSALTECPICLEPCTNQGSHRIAATKCGHLFGKECLESALRIKTECPSCRKVCKKREIISLYDCHIVAADVSVIEALKAETAEEKHKRQKIEAERALMSVKLNEALKEISRLQHSENVWRKHAETLQSSIAMQCQSGGALVGLKDTNSGQQNKRNYQEFQSSISSTKSFQFMWEVNNLNDARLLRVLPDGKSLVFSHRSSGGESMLTQVSVEDYRNRMDLCATRDKAVIRDVAVCPWLGQNLICHTGDNKSASLVSTRTGQEVLTQSLPSRLQGWSCAFSTCNDHDLWIGGSSGCLMLYDVRRVGAAGSHVAMYEIPPAEPQDTSVQVLSQEPSPLRLANTLSQESSSRGIIANTFPPIQSILHTTSYHHHLAATTTSSSDAAAAISGGGVTLERIVICQKGMCQILSPANHKGVIDIFNSGNASMYVPNLSSVYDIQQCPLGPWLGQRDISLSSSHLMEGFVFACKKPCYGDLASRGAQMPSVYCMSLPSHFATTVLSSAPDGTSSLSRNSSVVTGHSLGLAASKPAVCVVSMDSMQSSHDPATKEGNALMIACPDEATKSVMISVVCSPKDVQPLAVLTGHREGVRQTVFTKNDEWVQYPRGFSSISSSELRFYSMKNMS